MDSKDVRGGWEEFQRSVSLSALYVSGWREAGNASAGVLRSCNGDVVTSLLIVSLVRLVREPGIAGGAAAFDSLQQPSRGHREAKP